MQQNSKTNVTIPAGGGGGGRGKNNCGKNKKKSNWIAPTADWINLIGLSTPIHNSDYYHKVSLLLVYHFSFSQQKQKVKRRAKKKEGAAGFIFCFFISFLFLPVMLWRYLGPRLASCCASSQAQAGERCSASNRPSLPCFFLAAFPWAAWDFIKKKKRMKFFWRPAN